VGVESPRPTLCSKLCSSRVDKRRIGTGRDRIAIEMFSARTVRFGAIRKVLIDSGRLSKPPLSADSATSPQTLSVREISTWLSDILQSPRRRVFKPSPLPESAGKPADSAMPAHELWAHSLRDIENSASCWWLAWCGRDGFQLVAPFLRASGSAAARIRIASAAAAEPSLQWLNRDAPAFGRALECEHQVSSRIVELRAYNGAVPILRFVEGDPLPERVHEQQVAREIRNQL
jgi:hypothetical protein